MMRRLPGLLCAALLAVTPAAAETLDRAEVERIVREYLLEHPEVIMEAIGILEERQQAAQAEAQRQAIATHRQALFDDPAAPVMGNPEGDVTVVEFFDYQCGYCKSVFPDLQRLIDQDGDIRLVMKEFPILGPASLTAAKAALAAERQGKYAELHGALMAHRGRLDDEVVMRLARSVGLDLDRLAKDMEDPAIQKALEANHALAQALGIGGTPAFLFGEHLVPGAVRLEDMQELVAAARQSG